MGKRYSDREMKQILRREIEASSLTEQKIQEAYAIIRTAAKEEKETSEKISPVSGTQHRKASFRKNHRWLLPVAAACVLTISAAATVAAVSGFFTKNVEKEEDTLTYEFKVDFSLQPYRVKVTPGYIPEGYVESGPGEGKFCKDGLWQNGISLFAASADYLALYGNTLDADHVKSLEETTINGMEANLITLDYDKESVSRIFDKRIYLFNPQEGYVGVVFGGNDLTMDELVKVAENLSFESTGEKVEAVNVEKAKAEQAAEEEYFAESDQRLQEKWNAGVSGEQIFEKGAAFTWGDELFGEFQLTMLEASFEENADVLLPEGIYDHEQAAGQVNEDGSLKSYERITMERSGYYGDAQDKELGRDEIGQKLLLVKMHAVNTGEETQELWAGAPEIQYLQEEKDGSYPYADTRTVPLNSQEYNFSEREAAFYFDGSPYEAGNSHFFYRELAPGETFTYTLGFLIDEDKTENLYLDFGGRMDTSPENEKDYERFVRIS